MDLQGSALIPASPARVWRALNNADALKRCIPGCDSLVWTGDSTLEATVVVKIALISMTFGGVLTLADLNPPASYTLRGEGKGGVAGFAKGEARVTLTADGAGTRLDYIATAEIGGKLAEIGSRLVKGSATKLADDFFARFAAAVDEFSPVEDAPVAAPEPIAEPREDVVAEQTVTLEPPEAEPLHDTSPQSSLPKKIGWLAAATVAAIAVALANRR